MKEVMAILRMNKINATKAALVAAGFPSFTASRVMGRGRKALDEDMVKAMNDDGPLESSEVLPLLAHGPRLLPKRMISLIVPDDKVATVVETVINSNSTKNPGDGKIFVMPIDDVCRVRTGETGNAAIDEMTGK
ncbi:MAG TPA: P-II family nitrogen regulator [Desulfobacterales bacterium]|uniref:Nitrogen regulatory protein P-II n=1 Tax=hydrothermal vent metagenome TaxID=652676 RepID=A0A3B0VDF0_9ZZZZ|nr:P-II family nitrogen regulator [Desulfobacterales bacterium]